MMLRSQFWRRFREIAQPVLRNGTRSALADQSYSACLCYHDRDLAKEVIEDDAEVNEYEVKLEKKSFEMIALQQPVS